MTSTNENKTATVEHVAMPEVLTRRDREPGSWTVERGLPMRGDAWTRQRDRVMRVPFGTDSTSRAVRAHEMTHAKISPLDVDSLDLLGATRSAIMCAEEMRVNLAVAGVGFDVDALVDGSEKVLGQRLAVARDWPNLVESIVATAFTKGAKEIVKGARSVDREFGDRAEKVRTLVETWTQEWTRVEVGRVAKRRVPEIVARFATSTRPIYVDTVTGEHRDAQKSSAVLDDNGRYVEIVEPVDARPGEVLVPLGFFHFTTELAKYVDRLAGRSQQPEGVGDPTDRESDEPPSDEELDSLDPRGRQRSSTWATLVWDKSIPLNRHAKNALGRRRSSSDVGIVPRYVERLWTDPDRRIFTTSTRDVGGIVLIDQSGSMSLDQSELDAIVDASAGCVVIGYSHGGRGGKPNIWLHANRGRVASVVRGGNGGNGCDRPALDYVLSIRKKNEPVVWVCDGYVTYATDGHASDVDRLAILDLVRRHGVHMVENVEQGIDALRRARDGRLPAKYVPELVHGISSTRVAEVWGGAR